MQVEGIAEWSLGPALSDNRSCLFVFFGGGHFRQFLLYMYATSSWWNGKVDLWSVLKESKAEKIRNRYNLVAFPGIMLQRCALE